MVSATLYAPNQQMPGHLSFDQVVLRSFPDCPNRERFIVKSCENDNRHARRTVVH